LAIAPRHYKYRARVEEGTTATGTLAFCVLFFGMISDRVIIDYSAMPDKKRTARLDWEDVRALEDAVRRPSLLVRLLLIRRWTVNPSAREDVTQSEASDAADPSQAASVAGHRH
jgi:hypothetical protein